MNIRLITLSEKCSQREILVVSIKIMFETFLSLEKHWNWSCEVQVSEYETNSFFRRSFPSSIFFQVYSSTEVPL